MGALLDAVGPSVLLPLALPEGRAKQVGAPVIEDGDFARSVAGATVILVGSRSPADIARAARAGATAVVVRGSDGEAERLARAGDQARIAVLAANEHLPWGELYSIVRTLFTVYEPRDSEMVDLFELANSVARDAGGAVAIEDMEMRVVAYSSIAGQDIDELRLAGILGRQVPEHAIQADEYLAVLRAEGAVWCYEPRDNAPRLAIGIHAHGQPYGTIWILQGETPLNSRAPAILAEAARRAIGPLAKGSLDGDARRHLRNDRLGRLLQGIGAADKLATEIGLPTQGVFGVLAFGTHQDLVDELSRNIVADMLRNVLASYRIPAAVGVFDGRGYVVIAGAPDAPLVRSLVRETLARASERGGIDWYAGASGALPSLENLPDGTVQADEVLSALSSFGTSAERFAVHGEMSAALFLHAISSNSRLAHLVQSEPIATVLRHDADHGTEYAKTLREWIRAHYDIPTAADALFVHPNTLRHRLNRMRDFIDLGESDVRLVLAMQLRMQSLGSSRGE